MQSAQPYYAHNQPEPTRKSPNPFSIASSLLLGGQQNQWYYKDLQGQVRGPFSQNQMLQWYDNGHFNDELEIAQGENSMFLPLKKYKEYCSTKLQTQNPGNQT